MRLLFPGVEFLRILFKLKKRKENSSSYVHVLHKASRRFHVVVVQWTSKKCTKKRDACRCRAVVLIIKSIVF